MNKMSIRNWYATFFITVVINVVSAVHCTNQSHCYVTPENGSFAEQVIEIAKHHSNGFFTVIVLSGDYVATNGSRMCFVNFENVVFKSYLTDADDVHIQCPELTDTVYNGVCFVNSSNIVVSGISFSRCGTITSGLFFIDSTNILVSYCSFHHNIDSGLEFINGNNITITECKFYYNVGLQPDDTSNLLVQLVNVSHGAGLVLTFKEHNSTSVAIKGCNFTNNIAYKSSDYNSSSDTRPYGVIPFGGGGAIYIYLHQVNSVHLRISDSKFHNNTAIHQGGAIIMLPVNSTNNTLDISRCEFVGNKALGGLLRSHNEAINGTDVDWFVDLVNTKLSMIDYIINFNDDISFLSFLLTGGFGGAIAVGLHGTVERNTLRVKDSLFSNNSAVFSGGGIGFLVRDLLSNVEDGVDSNQPIIEKYGICSTSVLFFLYAPVLIILLFIQKQLSCKNRVRSSKVLSEKSCEVKGGGQEIAAMMLMTINFNSASLAIIKINCSHFWLPL